MGLYFAMNQSELRGNILELGSGVGLGGILSNVVTPTHANGSAKRSVTLTDINDDVLHMLEQNITHASSKSTSLGGLSRDDISIQKLDWFDSLLEGGSSQTITNSDYGGYDTIIASDCAYLRDQIIPLTETISTLLGKRRGKEEEKKKKLLHMFAPYNRGVVHELIDKLQKKDMHVNVEDVELSKYRIKQETASGCFSKTSFFEGQQSKLWSDMPTFRSKFLHITAWHKTEEEIDDERNDKEQHAMNDID